MMNKTHSFVITYDEFGQLRLFNQALTWTFLYSLILFYFFNFGTKIFICIVLLDMYVLLSILMVLGIFFQKYIYKYLVNWQSFSNFSDIFLKEIFSDKVKILVFWCTTNCNVFPPAYKLQNLIQSILCFCEAEKIRPCNFEM